MLLLLLLAWLLICCRCTAPLPPGRCCWLFFCSL
jgi:hypothetical protein